MKALCGEIKVEMRSLVFFNDIDQRDELIPTPVANIKEDVPALVTNLLDE